MTKYTCPILHDPMTIPCTSFHENSMIITLKINMENKIKHLKKSSVSRTKHV